MEPNRKNETINTPSDAVIRTEDLAFSYEDGENAKKVVEHLSLSIVRGSFTAIIGHNGSGKSTVAKLLCGILVPTAGDVFIESRTAGRVLRVSSDEDLFDVRKTVGMVFQNPDNQLVATVVEEDVAFAPENLGMPPAEIRTRVDAALRAVGLYDYRLHDTHKLSGGQKQRVAVAGVLAMSPECIIFDESTAMLDPRGREDVLKIIAEMRARFGITVILITHYMNEAALADRIIVLDDGKIALDGSPRAVFENGEALRACGLEVPQSTELVRALFDDGIPIEKTVLSPEEAAREITAALKKRQGASSQPSVNVQ